MSLFDVCAVGLIAALAAMLLREWKSGAGAAAVTVAAVCVLVGTSLARYSEAITAIVGLADADGQVSETVSLALRALGIGFVAQIGADVCRDLGEGSIATCVESVGRAEILLICLPEFVSLVKKAVEMIG